jgi:hypothetical protein
MGCSLYGQLWPVTEIIASSAFSSFKMYAQLNARTQFYFWPYTNNSPELLESKTSFVKTQKTYAFHFIEKIKEFYNSPRRHITTKLQVFSGHPRLMVDLWHQP